MSSRVRAIGRPWANNLVARRRSSAHRAMGTASGQTLSTSDPPGLGAADFREQNPRHFHRTSGGYATVGSLVVAAFKVVF